MQELEDGRMRLEARGACGQAARPRVQSAQGTAPDDIEILAQPPKEFVRFGVQWQQVDRHETTERKADLIEDFSERHSVNGFPDLAEINGWHDVS